ncbi:MAG: 6-phosphogluconolactonase, partial [Ramlibacter sp.]|nr:6-phosphogluconolactonase [Ramlibacter sp.]
NMANLDTDHSGRFLLAASYSGNKISVNAVRPQGTVDPKPLAVLPTGKNAHAIHADPSNRFVFVTNLGDDQILQYRFDPVTGKLTPNSPAAVATNKGAGPRHLVFHPNRRLVFSTNELDGTVNTYRLDDAAGTLTLVGSTSVMPPGFSGGAPATADLHLSPDGKFLYTSERTSNTLAAFAVSADTGKLTLIAHYPTEQQPRAFNIDPSGRYLLAVGQMSGRLSSYGIDRSTGTLRKLSDQAVGSNPNWVEIVALPD